MRWVDALDETLKRCSVLIAVIGRGWLDAEDETRRARRLDDPDDRVRLEVEGAIRRGVPLIPVLVDGASTPPRDELPESLQTLVDWQVVRFSDHSSQEDAETLRQAIERALETAPGEVPLGSTFAGHEIDSLLGRGGMGVVYKARDLDLDRMDALKLITPVLARDKEFRGRFVRESKTAARIKHPNVLTIYRAGEEAGFLYLVMQLVDGPDLSSLIAAEGAFDPERAVAVLVPVAGALEAAHEQGLVHRDVKPGNILVDRETHVYLSDFGLARETTTDTGLSTTGRWLGTADYVSPEQIMGEDVDARADIYSLGCVLFQTLTGRVPYPTASDTAKLVAHATQPPPSLRELEPKLPAALDDVVAKSMARNPADRYQTASEFAAALQTAVEPPKRDAPTEKKAKPPEPRERRKLRIPLGTRGARWAAAIVALLVLGGIGAAIGLLTTSGGGGSSIVKLPAASPTSSATAAPTAGGTLAVSTSSLDSLTVFAQLFEGLTRVTPTGRVEPALATAWGRSADGFTWEFPLRAGVKFTDGTRLDAQTVCTNIDGRWKTYANRQPFKAFFAHDPTCEVVDSSTVRLTLRDRFDRLPELLAYPMLGIASRASLGRRLSGTGPFREDDVTSDGGTILKRNPGYWGPRPYLDELRFKLIASPDTAAQAMLTGEFDVLPQVAAAQATTLRGKDGIVLLRRPNRGSLAGVVPPPPGPRTVAIRSRVKGFRPGAFGWDSFASVWVTP